MRVKNAKIVNKNVKQIKCHSGRKHEDIDKIYNVLESNDLKLFLQVFTHLKTNLICHSILNLCHFNRSVDSLCIKFC